MKLTPGQKTPLSAIGITSKLSIEVDFGIAGVDVVLFGLDAKQRIVDDHYTVLFSNQTSPKGEIRMRDRHLGAAFDVDLSALPPSVQRLMIVASHDTTALSAAKPLAVTVGQATFDAGTVVGQERAVMLVEIYQHNHEWRLAAVGQGFALGLAKLVEHLGGTVDEPTSAPPAPPITPVASTAQTDTRSISLSKVTLEKSKSISLDKKNGGFGDIVLNLNWQQNKRGGLFGGRALDLDLGCLYELQDGQRGVIQALGKSFGDYNYDPFIELDGDDRSGSNAGGETIRINGRHFDRIRRLAVFALIYDGAVRWEQTDARASIKMPGQPEVVVEIRDGDDRQRLYGMAIIENIGGNMQITNHARCYRDQKGFADKVGIHLRWTHGTKD